MSADAADFAWMARALQLARRGLYSAHPNPRVGCVIVAGESVAGEGWHERTGGPHAGCLPCVRRVNLPVVPRPM